MLSSWLELAIPFLCFRNRSLERGLLWNRRRSWRTRYSLCIRPWSRLVLMLMLSWLGHGRRRRKNTVSRAQIDAMMRAKAKRQTLRLERSVLTMCRVQIILKQHLVTDTPVHNQCTWT